ncbi:MAG: biotin/lipoyl-containing protein [Saprospiraceae bacterium]
MLRQLVCLGTTTNQGFLLKILANENFKNGIYTTHFVNEIINDFNGVPDLKATDHSAIAATLFIWQEREKNRTLLRSMPSGWRNNFYEHQKILYSIDSKELLVQYRFKHRQFEFIINDENYSVSLSEKNKNNISIEINGIVYRYAIVQKENNMYCHNEEFGNVHLLLKERFPKKEVEKEKGNYESPMPSNVVKVLVNKGQLISKGEGLVVLSSMKMENTIFANEDGEVEEILVEEGMNVEAGHLLLKIK